MRCKYCGAESGNSHICINCQQRYMASQMQRQNQQQTQRVQDTSALGGYYTPSDATLPVRGQGGNEGRANTAQMREVLRRVKNIEMFSLMSMVLLVGIFLVEILKIFIA